MKIVPKVKIWEVLDGMVDAGFSTDDYESIGLSRNWENALVGRMDRRFIARRERLEGRANTWRERDEG